MPLADDAQEASEHHRTGHGGPRCGVAYLLEQMPGEQAEELRAMIADPEFTNRGIAEALAANGYRLRTGNAPKGHIIRHHRQRQCACWG